MSQNDSVFGKPAPLRQSRTVSATGEPNDAIISATLRSPVAHMGMT